MVGFVPREIFFTKGVGTHREKLTSFEAALRTAGIAACNLVRVSSIFPPGCKIISRAEGMKRLQPGQVTFVVMSEAATREPHRRIRRHDRRRDSARPEAVRLPVGTSQLRRGRDAGRRLRRGPGSGDAGHHARIEVRPGEELGREQGKSGACPTSSSGRRTSRRPPSATGRGSGRRWSPRPCLWASSLVAPCQARASPLSVLRGVSPRAPRVPSNPAPEL